MNAKVRRRIEMGLRVLGFSRAHPDPSAGYAAAVGRLEELLSQAENLAQQQREGILASRAASAHKRELRERMRKAHLAHLANVAKVAGREDPEVAQKFALKPGLSTYMAFRAAARSIAAEAMGQKELLVKHGLSDSLLDNLNQALDEFDASEARGAEGRRAHVGASAELKAVSSEIVGIVNVMDRLNRFRFLNDAELLAVWESDSNVIPAARNTEDKAVEQAPPAVGGEARPAA